MSGKGITERIWVIFVIIFYCCRHSLETLLSNDTQCCWEIVCEVREEINSEEVFCSSVCGRNKNKGGSVEVCSIEVFRI